MPKRSKGKLRDLTDEDWEIVLEHEYLVDKILDFKAQKFSIVGEDRDLFRSALFDRMIVGVKTFNKNAKTSFGTYIYKGLQQEFNRVLQKEISRKNNFKSKEQIQELDTDEKQLEIITSGETPELDVENKENVDKIKQIIKKLPKQHQIILYYRLYRDMTLQEIGDKIGKTRERVRQIYNESISFVKEQVRWAEQI
jgi:RNA polymerase sigma factor (sigma-70 family)